jgi:hypothetical protein
MATSHPTRDGRNTLRRSWLAWLRGAGVSAAEVARVRRRIADGGGALALWAVLREDIYETAFGDGRVQQLRGLALSPCDAERLVALAPDALGVVWQVKPYVLELRDGAPRLREAWPESERFTLSDVVAILAEIPDHGTASALLVGSGERGRKPGPNLLHLPAADGVPQT